MKQLDEMERMARGVVDAADADIGFADETGNAHHVFNDEMLARAFLAVMPTVRAALDWHRVNTGQHTNGPQHTLAMRDTRRALVDAIDTLRRGMGSHDQRRRAACFSVPGLRATPLQSRGWAHLPGL